MLPPDSVMKPVVHKFGSAVLAKSAGARARRGSASVDAVSPFRSLSGTDDQVVFVNDRYHDRPIVVPGPGVGPSSTAAGVMNDILSLARRAR